jgi:hypothetical protein
MSQNGHRRSTFALVFLAGSLAFAQTATPAAPDPHAIPVIDGGIGPCSADFTITDSAGAPVYAAKVKVHIAYGFLSARKLDLEAGTNADGRLALSAFPTISSMAFTSTPRKATAAARPSTIRLTPARRNSPSRCKRRHGENRPEIWLSAEG